MREVPNYIAEYNRVAGDAPGPQELFTQFPGLCQYLARAAADFVNGQILPFVEYDASPQYYCLVNQVTRSLARAFGGCVSLGVQLGYNQQATEFIQSLIDHEPWDEAEGQV
ncbi:MAG: hypothetical protein ACOYU7_01440 [Bacillota bacterium]